MAKKITEEKPKRLVLLDSHAILHRAYHALPDFVSHSGEPTGALFGLVTMLLKIVEELKPDYIFACFDLPKPTYRHEAYEGYKAGRKKTDENLISQIKRSREVFEAFSIPCFDKEGFEADDILGTMVEKFKDDSSIEIVISSGDMDTLQLVSGKKVQVFTLKKGIKETILYDEKAVVERFGFSPPQLVDYKGLRGDPSDNIIGIKGIGEKTATTLLLKFGTVEKMYEAIKKGKQDVFTEVGITERVYNLLKDNEEEALFSKMLATIRRDAPIDIVLPEQPWKENLQKEKIIKLFADLDFRSLTNRIKVLFEDGGSEVVLEVEEKEVVDPLELKKTCMALWLINSSVTNPTLDDCLSFARVRSFIDAKEIIFSELKKQKLEKLYTEIELPLMEVIQEMQNTGVKIDMKYLSNLSKKYHETLSAVEKKIFSLVGKEFNVASPKQLGEILFDHLGLKPKNQKKTGTGARSTKESELEKMRDMHPVVPLIFEHRELSKLLGTYIDAIPELVGNYGRLHATFLQAGTTTGRLSSENPNLQNIPIKSDLGNAIRFSFVAQEGMELLVIDYSQIQLRIAAILSGDEKLQEFFKRGEDIHTAVAREVFGVSAHEVTPEMRRRAKVINFGIIYGMGVNALKANLGSTKEEAAKFYDDYFKTFRRLGEYLEETKQFALKHGFTETMFGRRRYFEGIKSKLPFIRASAERMAINAPIQGTEADVVKIAMVRVHEYLKKEGLLSEVRLILQIHDELVYEVKKEMVAKITPEIKKILETVLTDEESKGVPLIANPEVGKNWGETEEVR